MWGPVAIVAFVVLGSDPVAAQTVIGADGASATGPTDAESGESAQYLESWLEESLPGATRILRVEGGDGGSSEAGLAGNGGSADGRVDATTAVSERLYLEVESRGGDGGDRRAADGEAGAAGTALAGASVAHTGHDTQGLVSAKATAVGGAGGDGVVGVGPTAGGAANAIAHGQNDAVGSIPGMRPGEGALGVSATAFGGQGGSGANSNADGAAGGEAIADATGQLLQTGAGGVFARATGGRGGVGGRLEVGGAGGDARATASGWGTGRIVVTAEQTGGSGGRGFGSAGGDGADSHMRDHVRGRADDLVLGQTAVGGDGGAGDRAGGGRAGNASSFIVDDSGGFTVETLTATVSALGGNGGSVGSDATGSVAANGGAAQAGLNVLRSGAVHAEVRATGGVGGGHGGENGAAGDGGSARIGRERNGVFAGSSGGGDVYLSATAAGGAGGSSAESGSRAGSGASVVLDDVATGSTTGELQLEQHARGGNGGWGGSGLAGRGGDAVSMATESTDEATRLTLRTFADGGIGGGRRGGVGVAAGGGAAAARSDAESASGTVVASARASGGEGGYGLEGVRGGDGGDADAISFARSAAGASGETAVGSTAEGGNGGNSRVGRDLRGGAGGLASSHTEAVAEADTTVVARAFSRGGAAGETGRLDEYETTNETGQGAAGGDARATAIARKTVAGAGVVEATASAYGGEGGRALGAGRLSGRGGMAEATARVEAIDSDAVVEVFEDAGAGGESRVGANGIDGIDLFRTDRVSASTSGNVSLSQTTRAGSGGLAHDGGRSGRGGDAVSRLTRDAASSGSDLDIELVVRGGYAGQAAGGAIGSDGGRAEGTVDAVANGDVAIRLDVAGGRASGDRGGLGRAGDAGFGSAPRGVVGESTGGGSVQIDATARGGDGAIAAYSPGTDAGDGADIVVTHALAGRTSGSGSIALTQSVIGGAGGGAAGGRAGSGGAATSVLGATGSADHSGTLRVSTGATGGSGGEQFGVGEGGAGGNAVARSSLDEGRDIERLSATAEGGVGGLARGGGSGGRGGDALAEGFGQARHHAASLWVELAARGGQGGGVSQSSSAAQGGTGGSATARAHAVGPVAAYTGTTVPGVDAIGGSGGGVSADAVGDGGDGGSARAELLAEDFDDTAGFASGWVRAIGGFGGRGRGAGRSGGRGGDAYALAEGDADGGVALRSRALAGSVGSAADGAAAGATGDAFATAIGRSTTGSVTLVAEVRRAYDGSSGARGRGGAHARGETGGPGRASAEAFEELGPRHVRRVVSLAYGTSEDAASRRLAEARVSEADPTGSIAAVDSFDAAIAAVAVGAPSDAAVLERIFEADGGVARDFDVGGTSEIFGLVDLALSPDAEFGTRAPNFVARTDFEIDLRTLADPRNLLVGILDAGFEGDGVVEDLVFDIVVEGRSVFSQVVDATAGMEASLSGRTIDLGLLSAIAVGSDQLLDIGFQLRSRSWGAAADPARFSLGLVFGSSSLGSGLPVPEPSVGFLIGIGLILMATAERSRRAHPGRARGRNGRLA